MSGLMTCNSRVLELLEEAADAQVRKPCYPESPWDSSSASYT